MMDVPIEGLSYIYGDNIYLTYNTSRLEFVLSNKPYSICYHFVI